MNAAGKIFVCFLGLTQNFHQTWTDQHGGALTPLPLRCFRSSPAVGGQVAFAGEFLCALRSLAAWLAIRSAQVLHVKPLLHRDLKPQNILLDVADETATLKIADLGCAARLQRAASLR